LRSRPVLCSSLQWLWATASTCSTCAQPRRGPPKPRLRWPACPMQCLLP
jgi:hypothetical protein